MVTTVVCWLLLAKILVPPSIASHFRQLQPSNGSSWRRYLWPPEHGPALLPRPIKASLGAMQAAVAARALPPAVHRIPPLELITAWPMLPPLAGRRANRTQHLPLLGDGGPE